MKIKVLSWNIWGGYFVDLPGVISLLKKENADIVALQEVKSNGENQGKIIAKELGINFYDFRVFTTDRHDPSFSLGNSLLSKSEFVSTESIFLSDISDYQKDWETEPRGLVKAEINPGGDNLTVSNVHLAYSKDFAPSGMRTKQVKNLMNSVDPIRSILIGDFNSLPDSPEIKFIQTKFENSDPNLNKKTWRVRDKEDPDRKLKPKHRIDYVFVSPDIKVIDFRVLGDYSSDHFPITATLEV